MEKYSKIKVIGKGSFGYAVLVHSINDPQKLYIIKVIDISKMNAKQKEDALNEVQVLKAMRHPFIVTYRESFIQKRCLCIVMDYADAGDLHTAIKKQKQKGELFPEKQILEWFVQIALALKHVHDRKILHRDIKTQNIFLTSKGEIKLGDFGICIIKIHLARILLNAEDCAKTAIGTPYYLSPEICQEKPYNQKSDVWSLGCILYEMTTLNHAFNGDDMKNLVINILNGSYDPIPPTYSNELKQLIEEIFAKNPNQRPSVKKILQKEFLRDYINDIMMKSFVNKTSNNSSPMKGSQVEPENTLFCINHKFKGFCPISNREKGTQSACKIIRGGFNDSNVNNDGLLSADRKNTDIDNNDDELLLSSSELNLQISQNLMKPLIKKLFPSMKQNSNMNNTSHPMQPIKPNDKGNYVKENHITELINNVIQENLRIIKNNPNQQINNFYQAKESKPIINIMPKSKIMNRLDNDNKTPEIDYNVIKAYINIETANEQTNSIDNNFGKGNKDLWANKTIKDLDGTILSPEFEKQEIEKNSKKKNEIEYNKTKLETHMKYDQFKKAYACIKPRINDKIQKFNDPR